VLHAARHKQNRNFKLKGTMSVRTVCGQLERSRCLITIHEMIKMSKYYLKVKCLIAYIIIQHVQRGIVGNYYDLGSRGQK